MSSWRVYEQHVTVMNPIQRVTAKKRRAAANAAKNSKSQTVWHVQSAIVSIFIL